MKIKRNEPCPCGSGKKYKHCCLNKKGASNGVSFSGGKNTTAPLGGPFKDTPEGMPPLHEMMGFTSEEEYRKAWEIYTNYCENQLPPGAPVPSFRDFTFGSSPAGDVIKNLDLKNLAEGATNIEEMRERMGKAVEEYNASLGNLPPEEEALPSVLEEALFELVNRGPLKAPSAVVLNKKAPLPLLKQTPVVLTMQVFLEYFARQGGTVAWNGEKPIIHDVSALMEIAESFPGLNPQVTDFKKELHFPHLIRWMETLAVNFELIYLEPGSVVISDKGLKLLSGTGVREYYYRALRKLTDGYDWLAFSDMPEEAQIIQDLAGVFLLVISGIDIGTIPIDPKILVDTVENIYDIHSELSGTNIKDKDIMGLVHDHFLATYSYLFGFVEFDHSACYRSELLDRIFTWSILKSRETR